MIWYLTKSNHRLSIHPWVRAWLRGSMMVKVLATLIAMMLLGIVWAAIWAVPQLLGMSSSTGFGWMEPARSDLSSQLAALTSGVVWLPPLFLMIDSIVDANRTRHDIRKLMDFPKIVLATRGEYIGGHPKLPHGRFVYLALSGTLENPELAIVLPQPGGKPVKAFRMPVLDVQKTTQRIQKTGQQTTIGATMANVTFRLRLIGQQALLNIEYIGQAGRKHRVELGHFLFGDGEVQNWRNHIVCIQTEADTGEVPYGPWVSLPSSGKKVASQV